MIEATGDVGDLEWYLRGGWETPKTLEGSRYWRRLEPERRFPWCVGRGRLQVLGGGWGVGSNMVFCCCSQLARLWVPFDANAGNMPGNTNFGPEFMFWSTVCQVFVERGGGLATKLGLLPSVK
jgi:hypothetical protein